MLINDSELRKGAGIAWGNEDLLAGVLGTALGVYFDDLGLT